MTGPFDPGKDRLGERKIPGICLQLVDKHAGIESDPVMTPEEQPKSLYSQLRRSF